jgi:hypothetical protein
MDQVVPVCERFVRPWRSLHGQAIRLDAGVETPGHSPAADAAFHHAVLPGKAVERSTVVSSWLDRFATCRCQSHALRILSRPILHDGWQSGVWREVRMIRSPTAIPGDE